MLRVVKSCCETKRSAPRNLPSPCPSPHLMGRGKTDRPRAGTFAKIVSRFPRAIVALFLPLLTVSVPESNAVEGKTHADLIQRWNAESLARGEKLYHSICVTCHGTPEKAGS